MRIGSGSNILDVHCVSLCIFELEILRLQLAAADIDHDELPIFEWMLPAEQLIDQPLKQINFCLDHMI